MRDQNWPNELSMITMMRWWFLVCDGTAPTHYRGQIKIMWMRAGSSHLRIIDIEPNLDAHHFTI